MKTAPPSPQVCLLWRDAVAFSATVIACLFLLVAAHAFARFHEPAVRPRMVAILPPPPPPAPLEALLVCPAPAPAAAALSAPPPPAPKRPTAAGGSLESLPYGGIIDEVAERYEVDPHLVRAIIFAESGFDPNATSHRGARGLMQLMPATAKAMGVTDIDDPQDNIDGGVRYFRSLLDLLDGDVKLALAAYNAGIRHVKNYEGIPPFQATRSYVKKVLQFHRRLTLETAAASPAVAGHPTHGDLALRGSVPGTGRPPA